MTRTLALVAAFALAAKASAVTIDTVPVDNPGNAGEVQLGGTFGSVGYNYRIGKTEGENLSTLPWKFYDGRERSSSRTS